MFLPSIKATGRFCLILLAGYLIAFGAFRPALCRAETDLAEEIRQALQHNATALSPITVSWERRYSSTLPAEEVLERTGYYDDRSFFEPFRVRYIRQGEKFHLFRTYRRPTIDGIDVSDAETTFDGECMYDGSGVERMVAAGIYPLLTVMPLDRLIEREPDRRIIEIEYLAEAGFWLSRMVADFRQPPKSLVLHLIEQGARVEEVSEEPLGKSPCVVVALKTDEMDYRFHLDPALGHAVRRRQEKWGGKLAVVAENSDFVKLPDPEIWLPKKIHSTFHGWPDYPTQVTSRPLFFMDITVDELHQRPVSDEQFVLDYRAGGSYVADGRLPGSEQHSSGAISYRVPADPEDLDEAIEAAVEGGDYDPSHGGGGWMVSGLVGLAVLAVIGGLYHLWRKRVLRPVR